MTGERQTERSLREMTRGPPYLNIGRPLSDQGSEHRGGLDTLLLRLRRRQKGTHPEIYNAPSNRSTCCTPPATRRSQGRFCGNVLSAKAKSLFPTPPSSLHCRKRPGGWERWRATALVQYLQAAHPLRPLAVTVADPPFEGGGLDPDEREDEVLRQFGRRKRRSTRAQPIRGPIPVHLDGQLGDSAPGRAGERMEERPEGEASRLCMQALCQVFLKKRDMCPAWRIRGRRTLASRSPPPAGARKRKRRRPCFRLVAWPAIETKHAVAVAIRGRVCSLAGHDVWRGRRLDSMPGAHLKPRFRQQLRTAVLSIPLTRWLRPRSAWPSPGSARGRRRPSFRLLSPRLRVASTCVRLARRHWRRRAGQRGRPPPYGYLTGNETRHGRDLGSKAPRPR